MTFFWSVRTDVKAIIIEARNRFESCHPDWYRNYNFLSDAEHGNKGSDQVKRLTETGSLSIIMSVVAHPGGLDPGCGLRE